MWKKLKFKNMKSLRKVNFYAVIVAMLIAGILFWFAWGLWDLLDWDFV